MLVRAPITFGHTQVIVSGLRQKSEIEKLEAALPLVRQCVDRFDRLEKQLAALVSEFRGLAQYTNTHGSYVKTSILRTSAGEGSSEFRMHLVPLFQSHLDAACERFRGLAAEDGRRAAAAEDAKGGLIGWLGERETEVDWIENPTDIMARNELVESFRLVALAGELAVT